MRIDSNGITLEVEEHGPAGGVPLILIRGLGTQLAHWPAALIEGFAAEGFRTVIFDNRDVGLSQRCPRPGVPDTADDILRLIRRGEAIAPPYTIADMAGDVVGLMDALGIARVHVFGISMGGAIAQTLAIARPERLASAILVMTAGRPLAGIGSEDPHAAAAMAESLLARPQSCDEYVAAQLAEHAAWGSPGYPMPPDEIRAMAVAAYRRGVDAAGINRQLLATSAAPDRRPALRKLRLPCLVIHGRDDRLIPEPLGAELAASIPGSEYRIVDGMGHIITPALAPLVVGAVSDFITRRAATAATAPAATSRPAGSG